MGTKSIGLLGLGRFGKLTYDYLREHGALRVWTRDAQKLAGVPEKGSFEEVVSCDVVVLTVAISAMEETCRRMAPLLRPKQIVVDTCSVKTHPVRIMLEALPDYVEVLGTHPLFGPDSGKNGIAGLKIVLCPARIAETSFRSIRSYLASLGLEIIETTAEDHDRQAARMQALFHLLAQTLGRLGWGNDPIATPGPEAFARLTGALLNDSPQLFLDIQRDNPFAADYRRRFIETLVALDREIQSEG
ncbi:MAG: prephenate dehydrogenase [Vicinamibacteria bacterium]|nr:prephenate dehydrogenase [Vicinamibacteria bacterium]